ncbi:serine/threonine-protein kinase [Colwellia sp. BRX8-9]|uniref:serine/threonine protein kinase n=1 Tax=Colwellia sp. BRX8-9 TaxID=2759831 RepID=UPI0015F76D20|nr:serine/threonine-protein kinase [Colwellia sp. BRX8-9]MBA6347185.1 serine/threonine protein kinase [Colwellia sp. BRX8-9]
MKETTNVYEHFNCLIELTEKERTSYLNQHFNDDSADKAELIALLDCYQSSDENTQWRTLIAGHAKDMTGDDGVEHLSGTVVGQFTLKEVIGRGGMGVVYAGTRTDGKLAQQVAIKFLYPSIMHLIGENLVHNEAYILSKLNHQNITHVLDAGTSADGHHYFAMEYVDGIAIDVYCQQNKLTIKQRLKLFLNVCDAISKAHLLNIAHTDIKPGNILVNNEGVVKVLDFGIAKLIHGDSTSPHQKMVQRYLRALSINYASPEQLKNDKLTLQTDQYSLAILLHQLLTERTPFSRDKHAINEIIEQVVKGQVPSLISQVSSLKAKWQLTGDINDIVKKALSPSPEQRYKTLTDFSSDLYRYLKKRPISIKSNSRIYNAQKWLARSPAQAFLLLISLSASVLFWQQNIQIEKEKNNALEVANQLSAMFESTDPTHGGNSDLKAIDILTKGEQTIKSSQSISDEVKYHLLTVLAKSYSGIGYNQQAESLLEEVLRNKDKLTPKQYGQVLLTLARSLQGQLKNNKAETVFKDLLTHAEKYPISSKELFTSYLNLANLLYKNYKGEGDSLYFEYTNKAKSLVGGLSDNEKATFLFIEVHEEYLKHWNYFVGEDVFDKKGYANAIRPLILKYQKILELVKDDPKLTFLILKKIRSLYFEIDAKDSQEFRTLLNQQLVKFKKQLGENNHLVASFYIYLSFIAYDNLQMLEALLMSNHAFAINEKLEGKKSYAYLESLLQQGKITLALGNIVEAEKIIFSARDIYKNMPTAKVSIPFKIGYWNELRQYCYLLLTLNRFEEALPYISEFIYLSKYDAQINVVEDPVESVVEFTAYKIGIEQGFDEAITYWELQSEQFTDSSILYANWIKAMLLSLNKDFKPALAYWEKVLSNFLHYPIQKIDFYQKEVWFYQQSLLANNKFKEANDLTIDVVNFQTQLNNSEDNHWLILAKKKLDALNKNYPEYIQPIH